MVVVVVVVVVLLVVAGGRRRGETARSSDNDGASLVYCRAEICVGSETAPFILDKGEIRPS